jgi:tRNA-dihydrouridine synthase B
VTTTLAGVELRSVAVLAPMAGMTDLPFRLLCREQNCGLVYTELVHADTLLAGVNKSLQLAETWPEERPVGVQLYHHDPAVLAEAARHVAEHVDCDLIDLNMGCPVPKIVSRGAGAALMKQPRLVEALVRSVVDAVDGTGIPVTAKTRSGWDADSVNAVEVAKAIEGGGGQVVAVHARTRAQRHEGPVDWDLLAEIKESVGIPVVGNGGIGDAEHALRMRAQTGVDAVMIGRGAIGNPWIFGQVADAWEGRPVVLPTVDDRLDVVRRHLEMEADSFDRWARKDREKERAEGRAMSRVRGHLVKYVAGAPGERAFKSRLSTLLTIEDTWAAVAEAWGVDPASHPSGPTGRNRTAA